MIGPSNLARPGTRSILLGILLTGAGSAHAADRHGFSVVPYLGTSLIGDTAPRIDGAEDIAEGTLDVGLDTGFTTGLGVRYDHADSNWSSELGWEYRTNDASSDGAVLPDGNYASNTVYLNARYALPERRLYTPWVGAGLTWLQEIDLDSEGGGVERSFSDSGSVGYQLMTGVNVDITERSYLSGEVRYSSRNEIDLSAENGGGRISNIDYRPITLGIGIGIRF